MSGPGPPRPPAGASRYTWIVGVAALLALAYITLNTLGTDAPGSRGVKKGDPMPPFAVPLAASDLKGDAQVDPDKACGVRGPKILNSCELADRGPVVLAFFATRSERCERQVDVLERVRRRFPEVGFAAVSVRGNRGEVRRQARRRGWRMPVGYDHDGAVSNAYAVAICPTITFARTGGKVAGTSFNLLGEQALTRRVEALR
jgi:AhpC/TSA family